MKKIRKRKCRYEVFLLPVLFSFLTACTVDSSKQSYLRAEKLWEMGRYDEAVKEFDRAAQSASSKDLSERSKYRAAETELIFLKDPKKALDHFKEIVASTSNKDLKWSSELYVGEIYYEHLKNYSESVSHFEKMLAQYPKSDRSTEFEFKLAKSYSAESKVDEALILFRKIYKNSASSKWGDKSALSAAQLELEEAEKKAHDESSSLKGSSQELFKQALGSFEEFLKMYPESPLRAEALFGRAITLENMEHEDQAMEEYEKLKSFYPTPQVIEIKIARLKDRLAHKKKYR